MVVVSGSTKIMCRNAIGKPISLPADYLQRALADGREIQRLDGGPLVIQSLGEQELVSISTNYSGWHNFAVAGTVRLALWAGGATLASDAKEKQLLGEYGMYCVIKATRVTVPAYAGNFENAGGIYVAQ